ncbi:5E5 antigen-like [Aquila chrysaetos chrysaetos]|uniref:5E5 antigen-like n=1 Tax=Aquila chrysaetos chrysaetos TaxID=223781 RepID=UPI001B7D329C|nr:5E5 antigen-like [Aquila chrysaetos chrysaetos]
MVAERGRGEGGRGDGGGSSGRRRRRRRVPALVAPTEGGGHRDPGAAAEEEDGDGREKDERAEASLSSPRRSRDVFDGDGRSERKRLGLRLCLGTGGSERGAELRGQDPPLKMAAPESHRHRPARTTQARSDGRVPSARASPPPSRGGGAQNVVLQAVRLSGSLASHRHSCSGETEGRVRRRQSISEPSPHQELGSHFPALPPPPPTVTPRATALLPHVMPSGAWPAGQGPGWGCSTQFSAEGGERGQGRKAQREEGDAAPPLPSLRGYLPGAPPPPPPAFVHEGNI